MEQTDLEALEHKVKKEFMIDNARKYSSEILRHLEKGQKIPQIANILRGKGININSSAIYQLLREMK